MYVLYCGVLFDFGGRLHYFQGNLLEYNENLENSGSESFPHERFPSPPPELDVDSEPFPPPPPELITPPPPPCDIDEESEYLSK